jgi:putative ABC transport system permease protein
LNFLQCLITALAALRANKLRSALTMLGIIIGVAAVITMVAIGSGAQQRVNEQIRSLGANLLLVAPWGRRGHTLTEEDAAAIMRDIAPVSMVGPGVQEIVKVVKGSRNWRTAVVGALPDYLEVRDWPLEKGRSFSAGESAATTKVVLLGQRVTEKLFGNEPVLGKEIRIGDVPFTVIGVLSRKGLSPFGSDQDNVAFVPMPTAKLRLQGGANSVNPRAVDFIYVKVNSAREIAETQRQTEALLRQRHRLRPGEEDDFQVFDLAAMVVAQQEAGRTLTTLLASVALVSLLVGGISIMNIMLVSVTERTREIGLRLAVGARRRDVRNQFLIEAVILCLLGGAIGIAVGMVSAIAVAELAEWEVLIEPWSILLAAGFATLVGVFFGFYPALKASRLDPIEALRFE